MSVSSPGAHQLNLPVSEAWFVTICGMNSATALSGALKEASTAIARPFWCHQLLTLVPDNMFPHFNRVIPFLKTTKRGTAPQTPKITRDNYYTNAWSYSPCSCRYTYAGYDAVRNPLQIIGERLPPSQDSNGGYGAFIDSMIKVYSLYRYHSV